MSRRQRRKLRRLAKPKEYTHIEHIDYPWIQSKIDGHGGSCHYNYKYGLVTIGYIGSTCRLKVWYYNLIIFGKYILRQLRKVIKV
jgi:hypothetical protein